jgi:hypothetical protein
VDIGPPRRIIEVEPIWLPLPVEVPDPGPTPIETDPGDPVRVEPPP